MGKIDRAFYNKGYTTAVLVGQKPILHPQIEMKNKLWIPPFDTYEKELNDYNRLIGGGITNMRELNENLIHMKRRGDILTVPGFVCNLSTVGNGVFLSNPVYPAGYDTNKKYDLRLYPNFLVTLTDTGGQALVFWGGNAGTGETLNTEGLTGWLNDVVYPCDVLTVNANGHDIDSAVNLTGGGDVNGNQITASAGALFYYSIGVTLTVGTYPNLYVSSLSRGDGTQHIPNYQLGATNTKYVTLASTNLFLTYYNSVAFTLSSTNTAKQVLTPSATGIYGLSTKGGSNGYVSIGETFNPNSASYVLQISAS